MGNNSSHRGGVSAVDKSGPFTLTYFDIKGAAEKVRLAFALSGIPFTDERVPFTDWAEMKEKTRYGQLPYLTIGASGELLYQSPAILKYVGMADEGPLYPMRSDPAKCVAIEEMLGLLGDFEREWRPCVDVVIHPEKYGYPTDMSTESKDVLAKRLRTRFLKEELPKYMTFFSQHIDANGGYFLCGEAPTIADCAALPQFQYFTAGIADHIPTDCLYPFGSVTSYIDRMNELPEIKAYYEKANSMKAYRESRANSQ